METKQIEVVCPCCTSRLTIDLRTEKVLRSRPKEQVDETGKPKVTEADWSQAFGKVKDREDKREDRLGSMLDQERKRPGDLEERFRAAKKKLDEAE
ncbi:MAG: hypothetical protein ABI054_14275 [Planctomycetota bacterium]